MLVNTFNDTKKLYYESLVADNKSRNTVQGYISTLNRYGQFCERNNLDADDPQAVVEFKAYLRERGNKSSSIALALTHLRCFFDFAVAVRAADASPCTAAITKVKKEQRKPYEKKVTEHEFLQILTASCPKRMHRATFTRNKAILILLLTSAIRNSELRDLRVSDLNFEQGSVRVSNGKGGKYRYALFPAVAQEAVRRYLKDGYRSEDLSDDDYLFGVNGPDGWRQLERQELSSLVCRSIEKFTGKSGVRTHALRHTAASIMRSNGLDLDSISEILGHESIQTTRIYAEWLDGATPTAAGTAIFDSLCAAQQEKRT